MRLKLIAIQLMCSPYPTDVLAIITYILILVISTSIIQHNLEQNDPLHSDHHGVQWICHQWPCGDPFTIQSKSWLTGTIIKITAKHMAIALDTSFDVPLDLHQKIYILPKHLHVLEHVQPNSSSHDSGNLMIVNSNLDPKISTYLKLNWKPILILSLCTKSNFYQELMLLGPQFLGDIQELTQCHFGVSALVKGDNRWELQLEDGHMADGWWHSLVEM